MKCGSLNLLAPSGAVQVYYGIALPLQKLLVLVVQSIEQNRIVAKECL